MKWWNLKSKRNSFLNPFQLAFFIVSIICSTFFLLFSLGVFDKKTTSSTMSTETGKVSDQRLISFSDFRKRIGFDMADSIDDNYLKSVRFDHSQNVVYMSEIRTVDNRLEELKFKVSMTNALMNQYEINTDHDSKDMHGTVKYYPYSDLRSAFITKNNNGSIEEQISIVPSSTNASVITKPLSGGIFSTWLIYVLVAMSFLIPLLLAGSKWHTSRSKNY